MVLGRSDMLVSYRESILGCSRVCTGKSGSHSSRGNQTNQVFTHGRSLNRNSKLGYRKAYLMTGDRVVLFLQQRQSLDTEIVQQLGEREAAMLFQEDS